MDLDAGLRRFGFESFRPGQREAIETLLDEGRALLVAPTGGGKSLTYQLPAALLGGTTIVISPLIALMHDQVAALEARGVAATFLASTLERDEMRRRTAALARGEYALVYVAPERLAFSGWLTNLDCPLVAVDEAHCISEWGHDFRPDYLQIQQFLESLPNARVLACTATATPERRDEIIQLLGLPPDTPQLVRGFARPNLRLRAVEVRGAAERRQRTDAQLAEAVGEAASPRGTAIIYTRTRRQSEEEYERLRQKGWRVACYHAGLESRERSRVSAAFAEGELDVVTATNAFGMGIDRADVRTVIHLAPPGSIEAYYQEVGRAGRDDAPAWGLLMTSSQDLALRRHLIRSDGGDPDIAEHKWSVFLELMRWIEGGSCRHDAILRYFGDEAEELGGCGVCDVCQTLDDQPVVDEDVTLVVRKALSGVKRVHGKFGMILAAKLLAGKEDERLTWDELDQVSTFGILKEHDEAWTLQLLRRCVTAGWVDFTGDQHPRVLLTEAGHLVMHERRPARLLLPSKKEAARLGRRTPKAAAVVEELDEDDRAMFEKLREHRLELARAQGVPPYVVASDRTLRDLALMRPKNDAELLLAHGIGPAKIERYGEGLLAVLNG